jgi:hypothetical protein
LRKVKKMKERKEKHRRGCFERIWRNKSKRRELV